MKKTEPFYIKFLHKLMKNEAVHFTVMAVTFSLVLWGLYALASHLSIDRTSKLYMAAQGIHVLLVMMVTWVIMRLFRIIIVRLSFRKSERTSGENVPRYIITFFNWGAVIAAILFMTTAVFGKSAMTLVTAGSIVGAGLAFSLQGIVLDMISGLILDVERTYKKGDWIRLDKNTVGEVIHTSWRHVEVKTEYGSLIVIPNRRLTADHYENLSRFKRVYGDEISIALDHNVPVERGERVLMDALLSIPEVVETGIHGVYAEYPNEGGISYTLRFGVQGYDQLRSIRHKVLEAVTEKLHNSGMAISETLGEYALSRAVPFQEAEDMSVVDVLRRVKMFEILHRAELVKLSERASRQLVDAGDDIIVMGDDSDSLFVIAEGVVDIVIPIKEGKKTINKVVATMGAGNFVGDRALLLGEKRSATVRARTKVLTYEVTKAAFKPLLKSRPEIISDLSDVMLAREKDTSKQVKETKRGLQKENSLKTELMKGIQKFFDME